MIVVVVILFAVALAAEVVAVVIVIIILMAVSNYAPPFQRSPGSRSMSADDTNCAPVSGSQR